MSFIDWNAAPPTNVGQFVQQGQQSALAGYQLGQTGAMLNALRGVNFDNPASLNHAITGLMAAGLIDQAKAVSDLSVARANNQQAASLAPEFGGMVRQGLEASQQQQQQPSQQDVQTAAQGEFQKIADALNDLQTTEDPQARQQKAATYRQQFVANGYPEQEVDEALGDLSIQGLQQHAQWAEAMAKGDNSVAHPTGMAASQGLLGNPGGSIAVANLNNAAMMNPYVQGWAQKYLGIDLNPGIQQDIAITGPARAAAANAPYNAVTYNVGGPGGGHSVTTTQENFAAQNPLGSPGIEGPTTQQTAAAQTIGQQSKTPIVLHGMGQNGEDIGAVPIFDNNGAVVGYRQTQIVGGGGGAPPPAAPAGPSGAAPTPAPAPARPAASLSPGQVASIATSASNADAFEKTNSALALQDSTLKSLWTEAQQFKSGPVAPLLGRFAALGSQFGINIGPGMNAEAAQEAMKSLTLKVLSQNRQTMGLPQTDQSTTLEAGAAPGDTNTPQGIARLAAIMIGNTEWALAAQNAWQRQKAADGNSTQNFDQFANVWATHTDPRVFEAQYMSPQERQRVRQDMGPARFDQMQKVLAREGYLTQRTPQGNLSAAQGSEGVIAQ